MQVQKNTKRYCVVFLPIASQENVVSRLAQRGGVQGGPVEPLGPRTVHEQEEGQGICATFSLPELSFPLGIAPTHLVSPGQERQRPGSHSACEFAIREQAGLSASSSSHRVDGKPKKPSPDGTLTLDRS